MKENRSDPTQPTSTVQATPSGEKPQHQPRPSCPKKPDAAKLKDSIKSAPLGENTPTNSGISGCPLQNAPCDAERLEIIVTEQDGTPLHLSTSKLRRTEAPLPELSDKENELLREYDLVVECVAGYVSSSEPKGKDPVKIEARGTWHGRKCSKAWHPLLSIGMPVDPPTTNWLLLLQPVNIKSIPNKEGHIKPMEFLAYPSAVGYSREKGLGFIFDLIKSCFPDPKYIRIDANSCGQRKPGSGTPNGELLALVKIYRKDTWAVRLQLPAAYGFKADKKKYKYAGSKSKVINAKEEKAYFNGKIQTKSKAIVTVEKTAEKTITTKGENFKGQKGESYEVVRGQQDGVPYYHSKEQTSGRQGKELFSHKGHAFNFDLETAKKPSGFALIIERNDEQLDVTESAERIKETLKHLKESISKVLDLIKDVPNFGYSLEFSASLLEGTFYIKTGWESAEKVQAQRYRPVGFFVDVFFALKLFSLEFKFAIGLNAYSKALDTGIIFEASLSVGMEAGVDLPITRLRGNSKPLVIDLTLKSPWIARIDFVIKLLGEGVEASISLDAGLEFQEGRITVDPIEGASVTGKLAFTPIVIKGYITSPFGTKREMEPIEIMRDPYVILPRPG